MFKFMNGAQRKTDNSQEVEKREIRLILISNDT